MNFYMAQFTNQAQLRYGNAVTNSNIAVGEILEVLSASKTAVKKTYSVNDNVTYVISIVNSGSLPVTGLTLTDNLGSYLFGTTTLTPLTYVPGTLLYYVNGILQTAPTVEAGPPLVIRGLNVPAGGNASLVYEATVNSYSPPAASSTLTNAATISGESVTPIDISETITAETAPLLTITKSISPVPVSENGTLTYTFLIQNNGNAAVDVASDAVITDVFDPILTNLTATFNGTVLTAGTDYTYDETTGNFATIAGKITVPAATFTQDTTQGNWTANPGISTLIITGTI